MGMKNILALNDEAHHCYREKPTDKIDEELKGDEKKEAEKQQDNKQEAAKPEQAEKADPNKDSSKPETASAQPVDPMSKEEQQAHEQWLKRIPDDPAGLLRRKFKYQYDQQRRQ